MTTEMLEEASWAKVRMQVVAPQAYTFVSGNKASRIDCFLVSQPLARLFQPPHLVPDFLTKGHAPVIL